MDKKAFLIPLIILVFSISVSAVPGIPHRFYGTVNFSNTAAPDNFVVKAIIDGVGVSNTTVLNGAYGYDQKMLFVTDPYNNRKGKTIEFYVNGIKANETAIFENGGSQKLDLTVNALVNQLITSQAIENKTIAIGPKTLFTIAFGDSLDMTISSQTETTATIEEVSELSQSFFAENPAPNLNAVKGYEISISGNAEAAITIYYGDSLEETEEESIAPYKLSENWEKIEPFTQNKANKTINFTITQAETSYAIMGSQKTEETKYCEETNCDDGSPCTMDDCKEGKCVYTALPDGLACLDGLCKAGLCEADQEQVEQTPQATGQETDETKPPEDQAVEQTQETKTSEGEAQKEAEKTTEPKEIGMPTGFFSLEITPSTIIVAMIVAIIAVISTLFASYFLFRKK